MSLLPNVNIGAPFDFSKTEINSNSNNTINSNNSTNVLADFADALKNANGSSDVSDTSAELVSDDADGTSSGSGSNIKDMLTAIIQLVVETLKAKDQQSESEESSEGIGSELKKLVNELKNGETEGSEQADDSGTITDLIRQLSKAMGEDEATGDGAKTTESDTNVSQILQLLLQLVQELDKSEDTSSAVDSDAETDESESKSGNFASDLGGALSSLGKAAEPFGAANPYVAGASAGLQIAGGLLQGLGDDEAEATDEAKGTTKSNAVNATSDVGKSEEAESIDSTLGLIAQIIQALIKLVDGDEDEEEVGPSKEFKGNDLLNLLSGGNGNDIELTNGYAGGSGPGGEFSADDGAIKIANEDGKALGSNVEIDLKNLFGNGGKDQIDGQQGEVASGKVTYTDGTTSSFSVSGKDADNGDATVKLGEEGKTIASIEIGAAKGSEDSDAGSNLRSDFGIGAVRTSNDGKAPEGDNLDNFENAILALLALILQQVSSSDESDSVIGGEEEEEDADITSFDATKLIQA